MKDEKTKREEFETQTERRPLRPASFFRALALGALASAVPAAGCYESTTDEDVAEAGDTPTDARDATDSADRAEDATAEDAPPDLRDEQIGAYGVPEYGAP